MEKIIYRGETEREFELVLTKTVGEENVDYDDRLQDLGIIIVAKDYDDCWIAERECFLGWKIEHAQVAVKFVKGYDQPYWKILIDNGDVEDFDSKYIIYLSPEGKVIGETLCSQFVLANSFEEYEGMSLQQIERLCYNNEMSEAR